MTDAISQVPVDVKPRRQTLERRLGLEHSMFWSTAFHTLRAPGGWLGLLIIMIMVFLSIAAPLISPYDPLEIHKSDQFMPPQRQYLAGTDEFGRDLLSRTIWAGRISLLAGAFAVTFAMAIGVPLGLVAGYFGRAADAVLMRLMDTLLAFPGILLAMAIVAVIGPGSLNAMIAVAIVSIPTFARVARSSMLTQKNMDYVMAARSIGAGDAHIIFRGILPNAIPVVLVQVSVSVAFAVLVEAALSFLGLGTRPPDPSWGNLLQVSRKFLHQAWWYGVFPGAFLTTLIIGLNLFSEALRDALDPTRRNLF